MTNTDEWRRIDRCESRYDFTRSQYIRLIHVISVFSAFIFITLQIFSISDEFGIVTRGNKMKGELFE